MKMRQLKGTKSVFVKGVACFLCIYGLVYWTNFFVSLGIDVSSRQHTSVILGLVLMITFFLFPAHSKGSPDKVPWYDVLLGSISLVPCAYVVFFYEQLTDHFAIGLTTEYEIVFGVAIIIIVIEATRRVIGLILTVLALLFCLHPFLAGYLPWILQGRGASWERVVGHFYLSGDGVLGLPMAVCSTIVVPFIIFGQVLQSTGGGNFFLNLALSLTGHMRGGAAKAACVASGLFGMMSGSSLANAATTGVVTIPLMKRVGYSPEFAAAVEAVAANGGAIMPPVMGVVAFIMAEMLNIPYWSICVAAAVPAVLYYFAIIVQVDFRAAQTNLLGLPREQLPSIIQTLKQGWVYLPPLVVLIYLMGVSQFSAGRSALWATVVLAIITVFKKETRMDVKKTIKAFEDVGRVMCTVGAACAVAGVIMASIGLTGLGLKFAGALVEISGGSTFLMLLLTAVALFIMGTGLPQVACYIIVAVLAAPALIQGGINPLAAHLFTYYWALTSFITPPVCLCVYTTAGIAGSDIMRTGVQAVRLGMAMFSVPFVFVYKPALLLMGPLGEVIITIIVTALGILLLGAALEGYFLRKRNWLERSLFFIAGICFLIGVLKTLMVAVVPIGILALLNFRRKEKRVTA